MSKKEKHTKNACGPTPEAKLGQQWVVVTEVSVFRSTVRMLGFNILLNGANNAPMTKEKRSVTKVE